MQALKIYEKIKDNQIPLNEILLGCLIDTCVKCNQLTKAELIIKENFETIKPNTIIYTTLLKGYAK